MEEKIVTITNEEIFVKADSIYGFENGGKRFSEYATYINMSKNKKIGFGNLNILIQSVSSYDSDEELVGLITELLINQNIINDKKNIVNEKDFHKLSENKCRRAKVIISDISCASTERVKELIRKFKNKIFILVQKSSGRYGRYGMVETRQELSQYFYWNFKINLLTEKNKKDFIETSLKENNISIDENCKLLSKLQNLQFFKIREELLKIILNCITNKISVINDENINKICNLDDLKNEEDDDYEIQDDNENHNSLMNEKIELNSLIGLDDLKTQIQQIINFVKVKKTRGRMPMLHMVFEGNPGTGKTTIARIIGRMFAENSILSKDGKFVEVDREKLVGKYIGWTASKTKQAVESALGGVLFVDEAYSLSCIDSNKDYGQEAVATLIKGMEDNRDNLCVILAGYTNEMERLLNSNPGFESRIQFKIKFPDYTSEELYEVFKKYCKDEKYKISSGVKELVINYFDIEKTKANFGNARCARNLFEKVEFEQTFRIAENNDMENNTITKNDVKNAIDKARKNEIIEVKRKIGFCA